MNRDFNCVVRIRVEKSNGQSSHAFGRGIASLLLGIKEFHSLNKAAKNMGMSYSKAWSSINDTEKYLGFKLVERDGQRGSSLTERGERFLEVYELAEAAASATANSILRKLKI